MICGIDEAGRGPLAGPVCAAAVMLPPDFPLHVLGDSKALSQKKRDSAYELIVAGAIDWCVAWATWEEIGILNILGATMLAMRRAFEGLSVRPSEILVDGDHYPDLRCSGRAIIRGDSIVPEIMAASILAKVARDRLMTRLDTVQPEYGFARHKGYPTLAHRKAIKENGPSLWARPGFTVQFPSP